MTSLLQKASEFFRVRTKPKRFVADYVSANSQWGQPKDIDENILYEIFKKSPEVVGVISAIVEDILADGYDILPVSADEKKLELMREHLTRIKFHSKLKTALYDYFITGNAYLEYKVLEPKDFEQIVESVGAKIQKAFGYGLSEIEKRSIARKVAEDTISFNIFNIDASTIKIDYDEHGRVRGYIQHVPHIVSKPVKLRPDEVIHITLLRLGGSHYGFTPLRALTSDIATLLFAKNYSGDYFEHGGEPDYIFTLPDAFGEEDRNVQYLKRILKEIKEKRLRHKDIILTGNVQVEQINKFNKDLEYKDLIKHFTQIILMAFGVPPSRVAIIEGAGKQITREFNEGYYKKINSYHTELEDVLNEAIFHKYGMKIRFKRTYKVDELREAQIGAILVQNGIITVEEARQKLGFIGALPEGAEPKRPQKPLPQRDIADRQEGGRGRGQDRGRRLTTDFSEYEEKEFLDFVSFIQSLGTNIYKREDGEKVVLYNPIFKVKSELEKEQFDLVKDTFKVEIFDE